MFWSKIWFFLVAVVAGVAITIALVMPRPAERANAITQQKRLKSACSIAGILLRDNARQRVQLTGELARAAAPPDAPQLQLGEILVNASKDEIISQDHHATAGTALVKLLGSNVKPEFVMLLDRAGRVVARTGAAQNEYGNSMRGYHLVDDALDGFLRDDLWELGGKLYRMSGSPIVTNRVPAEWAGAVVVAFPIDNDFASSLAKQLDVSVSFYVKGEAVAASDSVQIHSDVLEQTKKLAELEPGKDCADGQPFETRSGDKTYLALAARLPGEAGELGALYSVFIEQDKAVGFLGTLDAVRKDDLSFASFPWIKLGLALVVMVGLGMMLMMLEADRPLRRLAADSVKLAQGERERLEEERYRGKIGSIARSVNIAVDKLNRDAKSARKELDQLLGPLPGGAQPAGNDRPAANPLPAAAPLSLAPEPFQPPPPSEFRFTDGSAGSAGSKPAAAVSPASGFQLDIPEVPAGTAPTGARATPPPSPRPATPPPPPKRAATNDRVPPPPIALPVVASKPVVAPVVEDDPLATNLPTMVHNGNDRIEDEETVVSTEPQRIATDDQEAVYFREIFNDFLSLKRQCGESTENLTFEKFATKLRANRDALIEKHGCRSVKFQVYVKDGKAALKASPVR